jgi:metallo-beta-lactamase family protein
VAEITFVGAAGTVTGSKHLLTTNGKRIFVDCGLFQGARNIVALNSVPLPVAPADVDAIVITHGHIDHVGYLPKIVHDGFKGTIFCTPPTKALMEIVLQDAAGLQQHLAQRGFQNEKHAVPAFYDYDDVERTLELVRTVELETPFDVCGASATFHNSGHIIGSAFVKIATEGKQLVFSGDIGRYGRPLLFDPVAIGDADVILCESTYGDRIHPKDPLGELGDALVNAVQLAGAVIIPAFAVERSQDMLLAIGALQKTHAELATVPVDLDSPMAAKVDALFDAFPDAHRRVDGASANRPFACANLRVDATTEESKALNDMTGAHIIVSASGMATGGRVLHHLHQHLADRKATILFVGYQPTGTLGNALTHGATTVHIFGDILPVRAKVVNVGGYSAHADQNDLLRWLSTCTRNPQFYAIHGEPGSAQALASVVAARLGYSASVAHRGTTVSV